MSEDSNTDEMPTAEDAVAGMLLRHGFDMYAQGLLQYPDRAPFLAERLRTREASAGPCIVAIEALARGDLRGAADHQDLLGAIARLTAERDEARAWVRRLTAAERVLTCVYCGEAYPPGTPDHGADVLTAHVRVCAKHPMREAEAEIARLRDREATLTAERDEAALKEHHAGRILREALRRAVKHLGSATPDDVEELQAGWDDYHAARMLVGCTGDGWDDAAAGRGIESIRREALGVDDGGGR